MANIFNYDSDVISVVSDFETNLNAMENQSVLAMQDFKQSPVLDFTNNEIHSDSNIVLYSQYLQETQLANVQDTNLQKAQRIKPTLYDGIVISAKHVAMLVIDNEETLILEEDSRSKIKPSYASLVKIEAPKELPKVSLVNESLKKLKFHIARFDNMLKIRTTPDACTEGEWRFEHTKAVFNKEIIPFLKSLKDIFSVFDRDLLNEIMEVQIVFDQMDAVVQQSSVDKK
ncbi:hypothetical protein Tco_1549907, partial [Tanacetum coccineum]